MFNATFDIKFDSALGRHAWLFVGCVSITHQTLVQQQVTASSNSTLQSCLSTFTYLAG